MFSGRNTDEKQTAFEEVVREKVSLSVEKQIRIRLKADKCVSVRARKE